jgi:hypothetical protein
MNEVKIRNWRQCLFKRFGSFIVKTRAEKLEEIFQKYNNKNSCTQHSCIQTCKSFLLKEKINNEAVNIN